MDNNNSGDVHETSGVIIIFDIGVAGADGIDDLCDGERAPVPVRGETGKRNDMGPATFSRNSAGKGWDGF
jgi:hypothetical protein